MIKILLFLPFLLLTFFAFADLNLELPTSNRPSINANLGSFNSSSQERRKGLEIVRQLRGSNQIIEDPEINLWIRSIGNTLTAAAPQSSTPFYFLVAKDPSINAFATRGGVIVVNAGLILQTSTESELAAVIAHEIAHVTQRHIQRMIEKADNNKLATNAALLAGLIASSKNPQVGQAIISTGLASMAHQQLAFSREAEAEADRVGLRILARAGYNPQGMPAFLEKLEQYSDNKNAEILEYLQNHPLTLKRVSDTQARAKRFGSFKGRKNKQYLYLREKTRAVSNHNGKNIPVNISGAIRKYSKALQLEKRGNYSAALRLTGSKSSNASEAILIAKLLNKLHQYKQTIALLNPLVNIYPGDISLTIPLAHAYMATSQNQNAWKVINDVNTSELTSLEYFEVLQKVSQHTRRTAQAYHSTANKNIRIGDYKSASIQLRRAIKLSNLNNLSLEMQQQLIDVESFLHSR